LHRKQPRNDNAKDAKNDSPREKASDESNGDQTPNEGHDEAAKENSA